MCNKALGRWRARGIKESKHLDDLSLDPREFLQEVHWALENSTRNAHGDIAGVIGSNHSNASLGAPFKGAYETSNDESLLTIGYVQERKRLEMLITRALSENSILGLDPPSGILLYGPSGCGKSLMIQAMVRKLHLNAIFVKGPEIFSKYLGETEASLKKIFASARSSSPCVIILEEVESLGMRRGRLNREKEGIGWGSVFTRAMSLVIVVVVVVALTFSSFPHFFLF